MSLRDIPLAPGWRHAQALERLGCRCVRAGKGSHIVLTKPGCQYTLSIPNHREVARPLIATLLTRAGISHEDYVRAFRGK